MHIPHMLPQPDLGGEDLLAVRALFRLRPLMVCLDVLHHLPVAREVPGADNALHPDVLVDPPDVDIQGALVAEGEGAQLAVVVPHPFVHRPYVILYIDGQPKETLVSVLEEDSVHAETENNSSVS